jgi:uncharacterized protein YegJ (DUF2314 family)
MATMEQTGDKTSHWFLSNAAALAKESPNTFDRPSDGEIRKLKKGDFVKLCFRLQSATGEGLNGERMWVKIIERKGTQMTGILNNDPILIPGLQYKDDVVFGEEHIYSMMQAGTN